MTNKSKRAVSAMNIKEYNRKFPDEKSAIDHFLEIRYEGELTCPIAELKSVLSLQ
jgi:hypothetical protein